MFVYVLLYDAGKDSEGIHSLELSGKTVVLMFENEDDALRYSGLLEAQDFPVPTVEKIDKLEMDKFCLEAGYEAKVVESGFVPSTEEERLLLSPPISNLDVTNWKDNEIIDDNLENKDSSSEEKQQLDDLRKKLEDLI